LGFHMIFMHQRSIYWNKRCFILKSKNSLNNPLSFEWIFLKIWNWGVENRHNYCGLWFKSFHYSYNNIIIHYCKSWNIIYIWSMWKLKFGYIFFGKLILNHCKNWFLNLQAKNNGLNNQFQSNTSYFDYFLNNKL